jgi:hypothetical protein
VHDRYTGSLMDSGLQGTEYENTACNCERMYCRLFLGSAHGGPGATEEAINERWSQDRCVQTGLQLGQSPWNLPSLWRLRSAAQIS